MFIQRKAGRDVTFPGSFTLLNAPEGRFQDLNEENRALNEVWRGSARRIHASAGCTCPAALLRFSRTTRGLRNAIRYALQKQASGFAVHMRQIPILHVGPVAGTQISVRGMRCELHVRGKGTERTIIDHGLLRRNPVYRHAGPGIPRILLPR